MKKLFPVLLFCLCLFNSAIGQDLTEKSVSDSVTIDEITVSAFRFEKKLLETPGAISLITLQQIQLNSEVSIDQLINQTSGVYMQSGTMNTNRLTIRGIGSRSPYSTNKIRAYFEGIPLTNGVGETSIEDLNLLTFSKVEIIKGPASGYYGSGLGGTLLFAARRQQGDVAEGSASYGSFNTSRQRISLQLDRDAFKHGLYYENFTSDGFRDNNQTDRSNLSYIGRLDKDKHHFNLLINHTGMMAYIPSSIDKDTYQNSPEKAAANWAATEGFEDYQKLLGGFSVSSEWKRNKSSQISLFANQYKNYELRPFNILKEDSYYWGGRFIFEKLLINQKAEWKFTIGNESFFEKYNWLTFENNDRQQGLLLSKNRENRNYLNNFVQITLTANQKLIASFGTNLNTTNYKYTDNYLTDGDQSGQHQFKTIVSPRLAVSYPLTINQRIYTTISHGFSPPSLEETLLPDGQRNNDIQPESGWSYELGSRGTLFPGMYYDISAYYMDIRNLLVARRVSEDAYLGINAGQTAHPGFEYSLKSNFLNSSEIKADISHSGSFSPYYFVDFIDGDEDYSGNELTGSPRFSCNSALSFLVKRKYTLSLNHRYTGSMPLRDDNSIYSESSSVLNFIGRYQKQYGKVLFDFGVVVNNITNEKYASMYAINASSFGGSLPRYYYPGMPRNFNLSLKAYYKF
ncbi:TonB-dependent receptor [Sunxiuqinia sp. A32]|uniref:TonB-dependent receptor n=1 Tax=Sunxiuqinia sp. A32 TaxID=3461496 RepID=UPI0040452BBC